MSNDLTADCNDQVQQISTFSGAVTVVSPDKAYTTVPPKLRTGEKQNRRGSQKIFPFISMGREGFFRRGRFGSDQRIVTFA